MSKFSDPERNPFAAHKRAIELEFERRIETERPKLMPPKRESYKDPRLCSTCKFLANDGQGYGECVRPGGRGFDLTSLEQWFWSCGRWALEQ